MPPEGERSAADIVSHVCWTLSAVSMKIADDLGIKINSEQEPTNDFIEGLNLEIDSAYNIFGNLVRGMSDDDLERTTTLPPPARIREGSIERVLRIMAGYHVVHHAGQIAHIIKRAKRNID